MNLLQIVHHFLQVIVANRCSDQCSARLQYTFDFLQGFWAIWYMIEHEIGDHSIEGLIFKRDGLGIDFLELERASGDDQVPPGCIQHPGRKIAECNVPSS